MITLCYSSYLSVCLFFCLSPIGADTTPKDNNSGYQAVEYAGIGSMIGFWTKIKDMVRC